MSRDPKFRVRLWDIDTAGDRGRKTLKAVIKDAKDVGVSDYANEGGEFFMTLPWNHAQIDEMLPWERHYEVSRRNDDGDYDVIGVGLLDEFDANKNEVIVYGRNYLSLFDIAISNSTVDWTSETYTNIIEDVLEASINNPTYSATGKPPVNFIDVGTVHSTSETTTVITHFQPQLQFVRSLLDILQADDSTRPIIYVTRSAPWQVNVSFNRGSDIPSLGLVFGSGLADFRYVPGFADFGTVPMVIGQKREGATILYANASYASRSQYGIIQRPFVILDVINQSALQRMANRKAREIGTPGRNLALALRVDHLKPYGGWDLGDSIPVRINRGLVNLDQLYTIWGFEWIGKIDGSEDLFLDVLPKKV